MCKLLPFTISVLMCGLCSSEMRVLHAAAGSPEEAKAPYDK